VKKSTIRGNSAKAEKWRRGIQEKIVKYRLAETGVEGYVPERTYCMQGFRCGEGVEID